ncbi:hypothetical protein HanIR_Chr09g0426101 [Helianthus annuus]|nr:hypothetical protein HanIR_Chr09g0426101 [Helianthus annuus]
MDIAHDLNCTTNTIEGRPSNFSECSSLSSVSDDGEFTRTNSGRSINRSRSRKWKKLMKKLVEGSKKSFYGSSKPLVFSYDAASYALNFDDGDCSDECYLYHSRCLPQVLGECS